MDNIMNLKEKENYVQIIDSSSEWNGRIGIVDRVNQEEGTVDIFCLQEPSFRYTVGIWNANTIHKVNINNLGRKGYEQVI